MRAGFGSGAPDCPVRGGERPFKWGLFLFLLVLYALVLSPRAWPGAPANVQPRPTGVIVDTPTITIAGASATSTATPTTGGYHANIVWKFGTVVGSYSTCTVQALTSYDGTNYETLGSAAAITVASGEFNIWDVYGQAPDTVPTVTSVSSGTTSTSLAANNFGLLTEYLFSCSSYGTSAPVTITVVYK